MVPVRGRIPGAGHPGARGAAAIRGTPMPDDLHSSRHGRHVDPAGPADADAPGCPDCAALRAELDGLRRRLLFLEALLDEAPMPLFAKDGEARFQFFNKAYEAFFGVDRNTLLRRTVLDLDYLPEEDRRRYQEEDEAVIREIREIHYETSYETPRGRRDALYWSKGFRAEGADVRGLIGAIVDISREKTLENELEEKIRALEDAQRELRRQSRTDPLTGLPNRRVLDERLHHAMALAGRHDLALSVIMADLDHFKQINDEHGHPAGDAVLRAFADILRTGCRRGDTPARIGGEEFAVLLLTDLPGALRAAERIRAAMAGRGDIAPGIGHVTVSIGVARHLDGEDGATLLRRADEALYRAKNAGRNRVSE